MDTITHGLAGSLLATGIFVDKKSGQRDKQASLSLIIGSIFPDIDFVFSIFGGLATIKYHRGFTHSLTAAILFPLIWAFLFTRFSSCKNFRKLFFAFSMGILLHISMDVITPYGTMIFSPFSQQRIALNWFFIIDPIFSLIVFIPQIIAYYKKAEKKSFIARTALGFLVVYVAFVAYNHTLALKKTEIITEKDSLAVIQMATFPMPPAPFFWSAIIETESEYRQIWFNNLNNDKIRWQYYRKAESDPFIRKAEELELVKVFRWFARFPLIVRESSTESEVVEYFDLRFGAFSGRKPFLLRVIFDQKGELKEIFFAQRRIAVFAEQ